MNKIILLLIINLFVFSAVGFASTHCENPVKMSQKIKCKLFNNDKAADESQKKAGDETEKKGFKYNPFKKLNEMNKNTKKTLF
jgi:hypothetical protein